MTTRRQELNELLQALYARVPQIECQGLCADTCAGIDMGPVEQRAMREAGAKVPRLVDVKLSFSRGEVPDFTCPALVDSKCSIYENRPMICRIYYADSDRPCPHGCRPVEPAKYLTYAEARDLLDQALKLGTAARPMGLDAIEARLSDPWVIERMRALEAGQMPSSIRHGVDR